MTLNQRAVEQVLPLLVILSACFAAGHTFDSFIPAAVACAYVVVQKTLYFFYEEPVLARVPALRNEGVALPVKAVVNSGLALAVFGLFQVVVGA